MSATLIQTEQEDRRPVRKSVRRLRWFKASFHEQVDALSQVTGVTFDLDDRKLAAVFFDWLRAFEAQKPQNPEARRDYVGFAAGLMLESLVRWKPLTATGLPPAPDTSNPAYFWPEGYVYVAYCMNIRAAVLEQDFDEARDTAPAMEEIRTWWSFKENTAEDPALAIAFLDLFSGEDPNWSMPTVFTSDKLQIDAARFYVKEPLGKD